MDLKTPSKSKVSKTAVTVVSAIPGAGLSKIASSYIPGGKISKLAIGALALVGAASITGTGTGSDVTKGMLIGAAIQQIGDVAIQSIQPMAANFIANREPSKLTEAVSKFVGLSSPMAYEYYDEAPIALNSPYEYKDQLPLGR
tara:strand:- start:21996 stop:22424 length:429 start_codon:yes stop_codon:yes gene_type:complete